MSYIDENLSAGEIVTYRTKLHWIVMLGPCLSGALLDIIGIALLMGTLLGKEESGGSGAIIGLSIALLLAGGILFAVGIVRRSSTEMAVTNRRVMIKVGLLSRRTIEIMLQKVESITVDQSVMGRMLNFGSIVVRGTGGTPEPFAKISHPLEFRRHVQEQLDKQQATSTTA